jgi:hypothetical protein
MSGKIVSHRDFAPEYFQCPFGDLKIFNLPARRRASGAARTTAADSGWRKDFGNFQAVVLAC